MTDPHCYLESLSPELLLPILTYLPDLDSLDSLLRASPAAYRVFDTQSATIFKTVLSSGSTHIYTCALIRIIALIRANALPPTVYNLIDFKDLVRHETSPHRWRPSRWDHPPSSWPSDLPTIIVRELLATNRKVQRLTFGCLEYYLDQFKPLRPFHSAEFSFDSMHYAEVAADCIGPWQDKPVGTVYYYPVQDVGPPSWLEEQRIIRAFWRIQLSRDVNAAVDAASIVWPEEGGPAHLNGMSPADFCDVPSWFNDKKRGNVVELSEMNGIETILEHELLDSAIEYTQKVKGVISESTYWQFKKNWAAGSVPKSEEDWETLDLMWRSNMWDYFSNLTGSRWIHEFDFRSPLQHAKFEPWRRYGFAIWSTARMAGYGLLLPRGEYPCGLEKPYYEAWRNLLTEDEREAVEKENKRWDAELGL
ncbi:uncharacterized protein PAC_15793 [Phialocephala subalpina]|uniref:F-box domain-containing protein n=1 Tax=Phialocephala subalpina TaxID=576137 RepID=A0A1L7XLJ6_9HELO|nr:uncharacterized protein PAC_15793 [Phialocephala subalpina]